MRGLKIIPMFILFMLVSYAGMRFVEANRDEVVISFFSYKSQPTAVGLVVLTSALVGMICCGLLCCIELLALYVQNRNLKRRLTLLQSQALAQAKAAKPAAGSEVATAPH